MDYYHQYLTGQSQGLIAAYQKQLDALFESSPERVDAFLMQCAAELSLANVNKDQKGTLSFDNIEGGPFAALIVSHESPHHAPKIIGLGANHVVPESDPSAHGEISAIRDAVSRLGYSDLSGMSMYTSCECCPQCQSAVTAVGIQRIYYGNDRFDAEEIGFSDEEQYRLMADMQASMQAIEDTDHQQEYHSLLGDHGAMILDQDQNVLAYGDIEFDHEDPFGTLPSMNAIRRTCAILGVFHLPEECRLICRHKPHPITFITADWARIGRIRDINHPNDPSRDAFMKDTSAIVYIEDETEKLWVTGPSKQRKVLVDCNAIIDDVLKNPENRLRVLTTQISDNGALDAAKQAFKQWACIIKKNAQLKY